MNHDGTMQFINNVDHQNLGQKSPGNLAIDSGCVVDANKGTEVNNNDSEVALLCLDHR